MNFHDVIKDNCENHSAVSWWPKFAFHYTDITNAVSILSSGRLYSRTRAQALGLMHNENASRQVIDMTQTEATACVRFYFRPLTPTQYYNEGFKHPQLRYDKDSNANVPVPVFLLFDLEKLLNMRNVKFSELPQSGYGSHLCNSIEEFKKFHFDMIYSIGFCDNFSEVKKYRHAEIVFPNYFDIESCINTIICRNPIEKTTLLNLLKETDKKAYHKYKTNIKICRKNMFENNGLYIKDCQYHAETFSVTFSDSLNKSSYTNRIKQRNSVETLAPIDARFELTWANARSVCYHTSIEAEIDYENMSSVVFHNLPKISGAKTIQIRCFFEGMLMCYIEQSLEEAELIR